MNKGLAVVTGASSGIGEAFSRSFAHLGYDLLLVARRMDRLTALATELSNLTGVTVEPLAADLACHAGLHTLEQRVSTAPNLAVLVNNAGFGIKGRFQDVSVDEHERMHRLHVIATMRLCHAALGRMIPADHGAIINVASVAGFTTSPGGTSYSATKHWMNAFTEGLYLDLKTRRSRVRVQSLCPGFTYSEFHDVMGMSRSGIPKSWWTSAEYVVGESLRGLEANKVFVIPGWRYRALVALSTSLPGPLRRAGSIWLARRIKK